MSVDTICALATAPGGALGIIRISGAQSLEILSRIFTKDLTTAQPNTVHYGHIVDKTSNLQSPTSNLVDEVLVSVFRAPHSYTGEESAEISCHGSRYILNRVLELLIQHGCRMSLPGEFTQRAYLNGKMDLTQAEAVIDLIEAETSAAAQNAVGHLGKAISAKTDDIYSRLMDVIAHFNVTIDYPDDDVEPFELEQYKDLMENARKE